MSIYQISIAVLLIVLTLISGLADAQGFVHASNIWLKRLTKQQLSVFF